MYLHGQNIFKVSSHDPIFVSNYSLAHIFRQQLDVSTPIFDMFPAAFVYWMKIELIHFPTLDLAKYFYKMAATAGSSCGEVGMKFSKQELLKFFELITK